MRWVAAALTLGLFGLASVACGVTVARHGRVRQSGPRSTPRRLVSLDVALIASVAAILVLTLSPTDDDNDLELVPLSDILAALLPPVDAARLLTETANILLFVPLGIVLGLRGLTVGKTAVLGLALSAALELAQLLVAGRTTSVDDVLLNTLGAVLGQACLSRWVPEPKPTSTA